VASLDRSGHGDGPAAAPTRVDPESDLGVEPASRGAQ
jgi:hypothetical protein